MATIGTAIKLNDMMTAPLQNITNAMNIMLSSWQDLDGATSGGLDVNGIEAVRAELNQASAAIQRMEDNQEDFNRKVQEGDRAMDGLTDTILGAVGAFAGMQGLQQLVDLSDNFTQTQARLNMVNDGAQTTDELFDKIAASADRARAPITDMADTVAKLSLNAGDAFTSNDETILFAENLNKLYAIAGTEQASIASASLQLTQALGSGVLRGEEFNAVFEAAPNIMQTVADYMDVPIGKLRSMAAEGQITADIVKNALLSATNDINTQFESMPMTWAQVWTGIMNEAYYASIPLLEFINLVANNWSVLEPIVLGVAAALGLYVAALLIYKGVTMVTALAESVRAAATMMQSGATFAATAAQHGFNAALLACPITWIIVAIIAVIAIIYAVVAAINKLQGTTISATGIITGAIAVAAAFVGNIFVALINFAIDIFVVLWNFIASFANFFANVFTDPVGAVARLFFDLVDTVLSLLQSLASAIDTIFGSNLSGAVQGWRDSLGGWVDETYGKGVEVMEKMSADDLHLGRFEYGSAWDSGYEFGAGMEDSIGEFFGGGFGGLGDEYSMDNLMSGIGDIPAVDEIAGNTGDIKDSLEITHEDLKYLRDLAEQEAINRFTTAEIRVEMGGVTNTVNSNVDLDGVMDYMVTGVQEAMERVAEGVHD